MVFRAVLVRIAQELRARLGFSQMRDERPEGMVTLTVIEGGAGQRGHTQTVPLCRPTKDDVRKEAERRIHACGYDDWRVRELATGAPMPIEVRYLRMQIEYAAQAIARFVKIPADFTSDNYWPV